MYKTNLNLPGKLFIASRPRGGDWLVDEIRTYKRKSIDIVVSHLDQNEVAELNLSEEESLCEEYQIDFISYPIRDRGIPIDMKNYNAFINNLNKKLHQNQNILIHCRMGIGRTGMTAAALLVKNGYDPREAFSDLSNIRGISMPDTMEQIEFIKKLYP